MHTIHLNNALSFDEYIRINNRRINETKLAEQSGKSTDMDLICQIYNEPWMKKYQSCELQLIGTPEDVEDLSKFPGILIRDVVDDTQSLFVFDEDYSYPEFQSSIIFNIFEALHELYLNPDERIYNIYIQMSDELIKSVYGKSNFFFAADKSKQKRMSIKNFIKYIDILKYLS